MLTTEEINFVEINHKSQTVPVMAKKLKKGASTIYALMKEKGWTPYRMPKTPAQCHPFRHQNRKMEKMLLRNRIENRVLYGKK